MNDKPTIESAIYHLQCEGYVEEAGLIGRLEAERDKLRIGLIAVRCWLSDPVVVAGAINTIEDTLEDI